MSQTDGKPVTDMVNTEKLSIFSVASALGLRRYVTTISMISYYYSSKKIVICFLISFFSFFVNE